MALGALRAGKGRDLAQAAGALARSGQAAAPGGGERRSAAKAPKKRSLFAPIAQVLPYNGVVMRNPMASRGLMVLALSSLVLPAAASFDMMLIPVGNQVRRYDPDSNLGLGAVSVPSANYVALDQPNNRIFVSDATSSSLRAFNYNTGAALGGWMMASGVRHMAYHSGSNSMFYVGSNGVISRFRLSSEVTQFLTVPAGVSVRSVMVLGNTVVAMGANASGNLVHLAWDANTLAAAHTNTLSALTQSGSALGKPVAISRGGGVFNYRYVYRDELGLLTLGRAELDSTGGFSPSAFALSLSGFSVAAMPSLVRGHNGYFVVGADAVNANTLRVEEYSSSDILLRQNLVSGYTIPAGAFGADNVVAPEPGTLAALALGGAALLRRKRKKSA